MKLASPTTFTRVSHFGTKVPKSLVASDRYKETTRTICTKGRFGHN